MFRKSMFWLLVLGMFITNPAVAQQRAFQGVKGIKQIKVPARQALYKYADAGDVQSLLRLTLEDIDIETLDAKGQTPLCEAVWKGNKKAVAALVEVGASQTSYCMSKIPESYKTAVGLKQLTPPMPRMPMTAPKAVASGVATTTTTAATATGLSTGAMVAIGVGAAALVGGGVALAAGGGGGGGSDGDDKTSKPNNPPLNPDGPDEIPDNTPDDGCKPGYGLFGTDTCHKELPCANGSEQSGDVCLCLSDIYTGTLCDSCITGYVMVEGICMPEGSVDNPSDEPSEEEIITCDAGYFIDGTICSPCPLNSTSDGVVCSCIDGYHKDVENSGDFVCIEDTCPEGTYSNGTDCVSCGENQSVNSTATGCVCNAGYSMQNDVCVETRLTCATNTEYKNGECVACPTGMISAGAGASCVCDTAGGYEVDNFGRCVKPTPTLNCPAGQYDDGNGACQSCPGGKTSVAGAKGISACTCPDGYVENADGVCQKSENACSEGQYWDGFKCVDNPSLCEEGQYWNGTQCAAVPVTEESCTASGLSWNGEKCVPQEDVKPEDSDEVNPEDPTKTDVVEKVSFTCPAGFIRIADKCIAENPQYDGVGSNLTYLNGIDGNKNRLINEEKTKVFVDNTNPSFGGMTAVSTEYSDAVAINNGILSLVAPKVAVAMYAKGDKSYLLNNGTISSGVSATVTLSGMKGDTSAVLENNGTIDLKGSALNGLYVANKSTGYNFGDVTLSSTGTTYGVRAEKESDARNYGNITISHSKNATVYGAFADATSDFKNHGSIIITRPSYGTTYGIRSANTADFESKGEIKISSSKTTGTSTYRGISTASKTNVLTDTDIDISVKGEGDDAGKGYAYITYGVEVDNALTNIENSGNMTFDFDRSVLVMGLKDFKNAEKLTNTGNISITASELRRGNYYGSTDAQGRAYGVYSAASDTVNGVENSNQNGNITISIGTTSQDGSGVIAGILASRSGSKDKNSTLTNYGEIKLTSSDKTRNLDFAAALAGLTWDKVGVNYVSMTNYGNIIGEYAGGVTNAYGIYQPRVAAFLKNYAQITLSTLSGNTYGIYSNALDVLSEENIRVEKIYGDTAQSGEVRGISTYNASAGSKLLNNSSMMIYNGGKSTTYGIYSKALSVENNAGLVQVSNSKLSDGDVRGIHAASSTSSLVNTGKVQVRNNATNSNKTYGLEHLGSGKLFNSGAVQSDSYSTGDVYGIYTKALTVENTGAISATTNNEEGVGSIWGLYSGATASSLFNAGDITVTTNALKPSYVFGIEHKGNKLLSNNGNITVESNSSGQVAGIKALSSQVENRGNISLTHNNSMSNGAIVAGIYGDKKVIAHGISSGNESNITIKAGGLSKTYAGIYSTSGTVSSVNGSISMEHGTTDVPVVGVRTGSDGIFAGIYSTEGSITSSSEIDIDFYASKDSKDATKYATYDYNVYGLYSPKNSVNNSGNIDIAYEGNKSVYGIYTLTNTTKPITNKGDIKIASKTDKAYGIYNAGSGDLMNEATITVDNTSLTENGIAYGIYNAGSGSVTNTKEHNISLSNNGNGSAYGVYSKSGAVTNNGTISLTNKGEGSAYGIYEAGAGEVTNYGAINLVNETAGSVYGIYAEKATTITNSVGATITITNKNELGKAYGIYTKEKSTVTNNGTITVNNSGNSGNAFGIYSEKGFVGILNNGTIYVNQGTTTDTTGCTGSACPNSSYIYPSQTTVAVSNASLMAVAGDFDTEASNVDLTVEKGSLTQVAGNFSGSVNAGASFVQSGFETQYVGDDVIDAENTADLRLSSASHLFNASLADNGKDVLMTMKSFDDVTDNKSLAAFLEANYAAGNNEAFFNDIKSIGNATAFTSAMDGLTGRDTISKFTHEDLTAMREVNFAMNEMMFANNDKPMFEANGTINSFSFKNDNASSAQYALANKRISPRMKIGYAMSTTNLNTDDDNDTTRRNSVFQVFAPVSYDRAGWQMIATPQIGFARGHYTRKGYNGTSYDGTIEKRIIALMNEARYPMTVGDFELSPTVELNAIAYNTKGSEDEKAYSLTMPSDNNISVEAGLGFHAGRSVGDLKFKAGLMMYKEFAEPYNIKMGMNGMDGTFDLYEDQSDYRGVASFGFGYNVGDLNVYGDVQHFIETDTHTKVKAGLKWTF